MRHVSRRRHLQHLSAVLGSAALSGWSNSVSAADAEIPPEGIGKGIEHVSYSDIGGRPDSVQVMFNRQHVVPPTPKKLIDPRPNVALAAKTCDAYVRPDGLMFVSDWRRRHARAAISGVNCCRVTLP